MSTDTQSQEATRLLGRRWLLPVGWCIGHGLVPVLWKCKRIGLHNVPKEGAFILAANHTAGIDGPLVIGQSPRWPYFMAKQELFRMWGGLLGVILRGFGCVSVDRSRGRAALDACLIALQRGAPVGIFPEGNRGRGDVKQIRAGVAWLAVHSGVPVIPVAVLGTRTKSHGKSSVPGFRRKIVLDYGEAMTFPIPEASNERDAVGQAMSEIRDALAAHVMDASKRHAIELPDEAENNDG